MPEPLYYPFLLVKPEPQDPGDQWTVIDTTPNYPIVNNMELRKNKLGRPRGRPRKNPKGCKAQCIYCNDIELEVIKEVLVKMRKHTRYRIFVVKDSDVAE